MTSPPSRTISTCRSRSCVVGDAPLDEPARALVAAVREAATNAARHAGVARVDVYVEVEDEVLSGFVRDRGKGFDPAAVPSDRRGLVDSVVGRMRRASAAARPSAAIPGEGTEISVRVPRDPIVTTRVFLVDDHALFRTGVRAELADRVDVVGEAADVDAAVARIPAARPDVVLVDVHLPDGGGARSCAACCAGSPEVRFLALSVSDAPEDVIAVIRAGARGYVTKSITGRRARRRRQAGRATGDAVFSPRLAGFVLDAFAGDRPRPGRPGARRADAARNGRCSASSPGATRYKEIARELVLSVKTVETHVSAVLRKLQLSNRHELDRWATDRRLL